MRLALIGVGLILIVVGYACHRLSWSPESEGKNGTRL